MQNIRRFFREQFWWWIDLYPYQKGMIFCVALITFAIGAFAGMVIAANMMQ